jgi:hypothetical protein
MKFKNIILLLIIVSNSTFAQKERYKKTEKNTLEGTKFGVLDVKENKQVIPNIYSKIGDYTKGKFMAVLNEKAGLIDSLNTVIIPFQYSSISDFVDDRIFLTQNQKCAMADQKGKILTKFIYDEILGYNKGIVRVSINNKIGYLNNQGISIIDCKFKEGYDCYGNFIVTYTTNWTSLGYTYVQKDFFGKVINTKDIGMSGKFPIIFDRKGKILYKGTTDDRVEITENEKIAIVSRYVGGGIKNYKIINLEGKIILGYEDNISLAIRKEWIKVTRNTGNAWQYGIINFDGKEVLKPNFKDISNYEFRNKELAKVKFNNDEYFFIDKDGKCVEFENKTCPE